MAGNSLAPAARFSIAALAALGLGATPSAAQERPINLALVTPIQIFPAEDEIKGVRLNLIYGRNRAVTGLDVGLANHVDGRMSGVQWGVVNIAESMVGWQAGTVNYTVGRFEGLMWGPVNYAGHINGLQLGIVNYAARASGIQIGLINIIKEGGQFPVMVIANWGK
ncbi:MAG: hypothetical protein AB7R55_16815 [Gemmatimonadales bacterium]